VFGGLREHEDEEEQRIKTYAFATTTIKFVTKLFSLCHKYNQIFFLNYSGMLRQPANSYGPGTSPLGHFRYPNQPTSEEHCGSYYNWALNGRGFISSSPEATSTRNI
jgi:hypothetical protein